MSEKYSYVRWRWWTPVSLDELKETLEDKGFEVTKTDRPKSETEISLYKDERDELTVVSDTLKASLSPFRALLTQPGEKKPFTDRDMKLRKEVMEIYSHNRPSPFPWEFSHEPDFEAEGEQ